MLWREAAGECHHGRQAQAQLNQFTLRSPIEGIVQASALTTVGQVVTTGEELLRVVPVGSAVEIEAYLPNEDIGFVHVGQRAAVKVAAFPFAQYGTVPGVVTRVGRDAVSSAEAQQAMSDTARTRGRSSGAAEPTGGLVFPLTIELDTTAITVDGTAINLTPGMGVSVEINTGSRRILDYLFSPMIEVASTAMRER